MDSLQQNFESLAGHNSRADAADLLERFDPSHCDTLSNSETFDDEIIPSSNPDSPLPDSMESLALLGIEQEVTDYVVDSLDPMEDMHVNRVNVHGK